MIPGSLVNLRTVERRDLETIRTARNAPDIARFYESRLPINELAQEAWFERSSRDAGSHYFVIENSNGAFVGVANVKNVHPIHRTADYGIYSLPEQSRNPLVAVEAAILLLDYAFDQLNLHKLYGNILSTNDRSRKFNEGLGAVEEGVLREHAWVDGGHVDLVQVALFRPAFIEATTKYRKLLARMKESS